ncbi:MAG: protein-disulfide reductase DsbD [Gammaproteobacteria bacterium]
MKQRKWSRALVALLGAMVYLSLPYGAGATESPSQPSALEALGKLGNTLGIAASDNEMLPADQAFQFESDPPAAGAIVLHWRIADGYYLYRDKIKIVAPAASGITLGTPELPKGEVKQDEFFGRMEIYKHMLDVRVPFTRDAQAPPQATLQVTYQGCASLGICYPPIVKKVVLDSDGAGVTNSTAAPSPAATTTPNAAPLAEQDRIAQTLSNGRTWVTLLSFFGFGLLLAFTPCVFPMVPILSGVIIGQGPNITTARAFALSLAYVLAMALAYTAAGIFAGLFGGNLQAAFQNPWILGSFSALFVALALSLFGFYELQVPSWLQGRLTELSNRQRSGTLAGAAIMGLLSALIVGPCVAAPLAAALIYIGKTGDAILGGSALFMLSLGMGAPLLVVGTSAGKLLPKVGPWMNAVKAVFGVLLLAVAIWMLERILPAAVTMALWSGLLIVSGVYLGAFDALLPDASGWRKLWKGAGIVTALYGALLLVGAVGGSDDVLHPLQGLQASTGRGAAAPATAFTRIKTVADLDRALTGAKANGQAAMLDFYADWCVSCKELEKYTFADPRIQRLLAARLLLQADVTANDAEDQALLAHFGLIGPPSILFFSPAGAECPGRRVVGYLPPEQFQSFAAPTAC